MTLGILKNLFNRFPERCDRRLDALKDFSMAAPFVLDPERLYDALEMLERFGWDAEKAARHVRNTYVLDFDDAILEKGDDPFELNEPPGPSG